MSSHLFLEFFVVVVAVVVGESWWSSGDSLDRIVPSEQLPTLATRK